MSMYSTQYLVGAPFAWITAAMRRGMESISLWHCSGVMRAQVALIVAFSSSALLGLAYRIFLFTIPHRFSMVLRSGEFAQLVLRGPKCAKKISPTPLHHHQQLEPLRQGWIDPCFHVLYAKFWPHHLNVAAKIETHQTRQRFFQSSIVQFWWACVNCGLRFLLLADRSGTRCDLLLL